jgi:uncharacterized protein YoaH (UPF0181 family)
MRPTEAAWKNMVSTLRQYVSEGRMSDDESVAIVANSLTEDLLSELDDDYGPDSASITEAIERVRDELRREHLASANAKIEEIKKSHASTMEEARAREESVLAELNTARRIASEASDLATRQFNKTKQSIEHFARIVGLLCRWAIVSILLAGSLFSFVTIPHSAHPNLQIFIVFLFCAAGVISFLGNSWGISAKSIGSNCEMWLASQLKRFLL